MSKNYGYTTEQEKYILEKVDAAKENGLNVRDVISLIADEMGKSFATVQTKYYNLKKEREEAEQLSFEEETELDLVEYSEKDTKMTQDFYAQLQKDSVERETDSIHAKALVNKLEQVIGEKIELKMERDYYKKAFEELQERYKQFRDLLEGK